MVTVVAVGCVPARGVHTELDKLCASPHFAMPPYDGEPRLSWNSVAQEGAAGEAGSSRTGYSRPSILAGDTR